jgi:hypothetical protein
MINDYQKGGVVKTNVGPQVLWLTASPMRVSAWGMPRWDLCGKIIVGFVGGFVGGQRGWGAALSGHGAKNHLMNPPMNRAAS